MSNNEKTKMTKSLRTSVLSGLVLFTLLVWGVPTAQASLILELDNHFGTIITPPQGPTPWLTATFTDVVPGTVTLELKTNLIDSERVKDWGFNLDPSLLPGFDATDLGFSAPSTIGGSFTAPTITAGVDFWQSDGDGKYDIRFAFDISADSNLYFGQGDIVEYTITGDGLLAEYFDFLSTPGGGAGQYKSAAHVLSIGAGATSAWVGTPEPATLIVLALGLLPMLLGKSRKFRKQS